MQAYPFKLWLTACLIFAFLGVLAFSGKNNIYSSITGARHDHIGGAVYYANW